MAGDFILAGAIASVLALLLRLMGWWPRLTEADERFRVTPLLLLVLATWAGGVWFDGLAIGWATYEWLAYALAGIVAAAGLAALTAPWTERWTRARRRPRNRASWGRAPVPFIPVSAVGVLMLSLAVVIAVQYA